jgi:hypothetical protein
MIKKILGLLIVFLLILTVAMAPLEQSYACYGQGIPDPQPVQPNICP